MKKWIAVFFVGLFLSGCGAAARESEFWEHDSMYKNRDHMLYSWYRHKDCKPEAGKMSVEQGWWGISTCEAPNK